MPRAGPTLSARKLLMLNERSLFRYRDALSAITPQRHAAGFDNDIRLLGALAGVPPEEIASGTQTGLRDFAITAKIGGHRVPSLVDTGASFCAISRSAARRSGLQIRAVGYRIRAARGEAVYADVAVSDLDFGDVRIRNVVFLVLPDTAFWNSSSLALIGLPVLRQLALEIGRKGSNAAAVPAPIAFEAGAPVLRIAVNGVWTRCELDSGSNRSWFAASRVPIRAFDGLDRSGRGVRVTEIDGKTYRLHAMRFRTRVAIGDKSVTIPDALAISNARPAGTTVGCTLGRDALARLAPFTLDFRSMRIVFE